MFPVLVLVSFLAVSAAHPHHTIVSTLAQRQTGASPGTNACNVTCAELSALETQCNVPHCRCNIPFLQAQGNCFSSCPHTGNEYDVDEAIADVQIMLDDEMAQCRRQGIVVNFQLQLPPAAAAILQEFYDQSEQLRRYQVSFLVLQIAGGHVGLVLVLLASFSRKVNRHPTFINFCITWIFSSVVFSLSLYRGTQQNTLGKPLGDVSTMMCLAQGALTNGAQAMTACSTMAVVMELWLSLRTAIQFRGDVTRGSKPAQWTTTVLVVAPYILFLAFTLPSFFIGANRERTFSPSALGDRSLSAVRPTHFYCTIVLTEAFSSFVRALYGATLGLLLLTVYFDASIIHILCRELYAFGQLQLKRPVKLSTLLRVIAFSIFRVVVAVAYGTLIFKPPRQGSTTPSFVSAVTLSTEFDVPVWIDILQASIPFVAFLIFSMNKDTMFALAFWRNIKTKSMQHDECQAPAG